ncbi:MAG: 4Fe-4S binding protein [Ardenticatenaceae bacterium]|nr:4Fe-4S binding protein [Ardenticatenaceae bacterium]
MASCWAILFAEEQMDADWPVPLVDLSRCDGCGLCVQVCPLGALGMLDGWAVVTRPGECQYTGHCAQVCPQQAIALTFCLMPEPCLEN